MYKVVPYRRVRHRAAAGGLIWVTVLVVLYIQGWQTASEIYVYAILGWILAAVYWWLSRSFMLMCMGERVGIAIGKSAQIEFLTRKSWWLYNLSPLVFLRYFLPWLFRIRMLI